MGGLNYLLHEIKNQSKRIYIIFMCKYYNYHLLFSNHHEIDQIFKNV